MIQWRVWGYQRHALVHFDPGSRLEEIPLKLSLDEVQYTRLGMRLAHLELCGIRVKRRVFSDWAVSFHQPYLEEISRLSKYFLWWTCIWMTSWRVGGIKDTLRYTFDPGPRLEKISLGLRFKRVQVRVIRQVFAKHIAFRFTGPNILFFSCHWKGENSTSHIMAILCAPSSIRIR